MAAFFVGTLFKELSLLSAFFVWAASGETLDPGLPDRTMVARNAVLPVGGNVLERTSDGGGAEVERCAFAVSASSSHRDMVQWCLGTDAV